MYRSSSFPGEVLKLIKEAIVFHLEGLREQGAMAFVLGLAAFV